MIGKLTLQEKIDMIHGDTLFNTKAVERLGIPALKTSDGPAGVRQEFEPDSWTPINDGGDFVSWMPSNACLASTWNPLLSYEFGQVLGSEARGRGKDVILAPGINIKRTPLCGRNFEYLSEDPQLTSALCVPLIKGVQENDVATCVKHFALNNQEHERMTYEADVDERTLHELYLPAFHAACERAHTYSIMASYNKYHGEYVCANEELIQNVLRDKWKYDGVVFSDWGGVHDTVNTAIHGVDIDMSVTSNFDEYYFASPLKHAVENGEVPEEIIDEKVERILHMMKRLHMLEGPRKHGTYNTLSHHRKIREVAEEGIVLLKNEDDHLPLSRHKHRIAVIGDNATRSHANGGGSAETKALYDISPYLGIKMLLGGNTEVLYAPGYYIDNEDKVIGDVDWQASSLSVDYNAPDQRKLYKSTILPKQKALREEAIALAKTCDEVIFVGGLNHSFDVEGFDRPDMKLPYAQDELIEALLDANRSTIITLITGSPVEMPWLNKTRNLVLTSYLGMCGGTALANVIFGKVNPSGRLAESYPLQLSDCSVHAYEESYPGVGPDNEHLITEYKEGIFVGYRYYDTNHIPVAFPFGYGLSYVTFKYRTLQITQSAHHINFEVNIKNIGMRSGKEVVQVYIGEDSPTVPRPTKELRTFAKVTLEAGEEQTVIMRIRKSSLGYYDTAIGDFHVNPGSYTVYVGKSVNDILLTDQITITE